MEALAEGNPDVRAAPTALGSAALSSTATVYGASSSFRSGQRVRVVGLKARPELNGLEGTVNEWDETQGRWKVRMDDGAGKMYKPENMEVVAEQSGGAAAPPPAPVADAASSTQQGDVGNGRGGFRSG